MIPPANLFGSNILRAFISFGISSILARPTSSINPSLFLWNSLVNSLVSSVAVLALTGSDVSGTEKAFESPLFVGISDGTGSSGGLFLTHRENNDAPNITVAYVNSKGITPPAALFDMTFKVIGHGGRQDVLELGLTELLTAGDYTSLLPVTEVTYSFTSGKRLFS